jgi:putative ABC transport system permease protein
MVAIAERLRREHPDTNATVPTALVTFTAGMQDPGAAPFLSLVLAASALLLLIACANIANLLLARGAERAHEFALRLALGSGHGRLVWQSLLEAGLLTFGAIALAIPLAAAGLAAARVSIPPSIVRFVPGWDYLQVSPTLFGVTALAGFFATLLFALIPGLQMVRVGVADTLRQGTRTMTAGRQRHWLRNGLAAAQVAMTVALLFGSGLMLSAVDRAANGPMGFDKGGLLVAGLRLPEVPYADPERRRQFINGVLERMRAIPAVSEVSMVSHLPFGGGNTSRPFWPEGVSLREGDVRQVDFRRVTPTYFETVRIPLLAGRGLDDTDRADTQLVAVVSQSLADRYWPGGHAIGRQFRLAADGSPITVVGIVGDVLQDWFQQRRAPTVYCPLAQDAPFLHSYTVRTIGDPLSVAGDVRRAVRALDADQPIIRLQSMQDLIDDRTAGIRLISRMLVVVALIAFALAVLGLYSLMAFMVSRRTQELGVRLALGATRWQIIGVTTRQGAWVTLVGLAAGAAAAVGLGRVMESILYGIVVLSVGQLVALVGLIAGVAMLASYLPARRTASLDPTTALRAE